MNKKRIYISKESKKTFIKFGFWCQTFLGEPVAKVKATTER